MKKTIIALLALAGYAIGSTENITYTSTAIGTPGGGYEAKGFAFNLSGTALKTVSDPEAYVFPESVTLNSIGFNTRKINNNGAAKNGSFSIVITDTSANILGWSTNSSSPTSTSSEDFTWTFNNIVLDTQSTYYAIAYAPDTTTLTKGSTLATYTKFMQFGSTGVSDYGANGLSFDDATAGKTGLMFLKSDIIGINTGSKTYAPNVTIVTKTIPEPTTATLSLLALAGLAVRRRRR